MSNLNQQLLMQPLQTSGTSFARINHVKGGTNFIALLKKTNLNERLEV
jgi:hypothetical protein